VADWARQELASWARERGLDLREEGLLAPTNPVLAAGLGAGSHRAGIVTQYSAHSLTSVGGFTKRPERITLNLCSGRLPGGVDGVLAHHIHLVQDLREQGTWDFLPHTVVVVHIPEAVRAFRDVTRRHDGSLVADPPEDGDALARHVAGGPLAEALGHLGEDVDLSLHDGWLCISVSQVWSDAARLDWLCHAAARFVAGVRSAVAAQPALDHERPLPPPRDNPATPWMEDGLLAVDWPEPPPSVEAGVAAYADGLRPASRSRGRKAGLIALVASVVALVLFAALDAIALAFGVPPEFVLAGIFFEIVVFLPWTVRAAWKAGREFGEDDLSFRSRHLGLEAFSRGYATARGLAQEDRDELRRRLDPPLPGAPLRSWHGRLGATGVPGRLVMWIDRSEGGTTDYSLLAVVPPPAGEVTGIGGYGVTRTSNALVLIDRHVEGDRSAARLDALAAAAGRTALQRRDMLQGLPT